MRRIASAGFYAMPAAEYHADPVIEPALSSSIGGLILDRSLAHAFVKHPRLTPQPPEEPKPGRDWGSAVHRLALGAGPNIAVIQGFDDWKKKDAQTARKEAYAAGEIPILAHEHDEATKAAKILREHLREEIGAKFDAELVMIWREGRAWCRTMLDAVSPDRLISVDVKTSGVCCNPNADLMKHLDNQGYDFQTAFQSRGLDALHPEGRGRRKFKLLWQENEPPYATSCTDITESTLHLMRKHVIAAINLWSDAMETGEWPGYPRRAVRFEKPKWSEEALLAREMAEPHLYEEHVHERASTTV
jgi:hypothetical protein